MNDEERKLNEEGRVTWDHKAQFWDTLHGEEGNIFHRRVVSPPVERLLALKPGDRVLDIGCGTGVLARRLAALGAQVTAVDFSPGMVERAKAHGQSAGEPIRYDVVDATDEESLAALGEGSFDAVVSTMALMDMPVIAPMYRASRRLINSGGCVVIATVHPAFNSANPVFFAEREELESGVVLRRGVKFTTYLDSPPFKAAGAPDDPHPHTYYHRPLHELLSEAFAAGMVLNGLEEPGFNPDDADESRFLAWRNIPQLPPTMVLRFVPK